MKLTEGGFGREQYTTGAPQRNYWFNRKANRFQQPHTKTASSQGSDVISYYIIKDGKFTKINAAPIGTINLGDHQEFIYEFADGRLLNKKEIKEASMNNARQLYKSIKHRVANLSALVYTAQKNLGLDRSRTKLELGFLLTEGLVEHVGDNILVAIN